MSFLKLRKMLLTAGIVTAFHACSYSIRIANKNGTPEDSPFNQELGYYNGKRVTKIDTVVHLSLLQNGIMVVDSTCLSGGFHSVEYKITFGAMLRNTFSFGKKRSIKVKCTCLKNSN